MAIWPRKPYWKNPGEQLRNPISFPAGCSAFLFVHIATPSPRFPYSTRPMASLRPAPYAPRRQSQPCAKEALVYNNGRGTTNFLIGLSLGVGIGLLFAPLSGEETREWLTEN